MKTPYRCIFCGAASWRDPSDQDAPADYCGEADHSPLDDEAAALRRERDEARRDRDMLRLCMNDAACRALVSERDELRTQVHIITSERDELADCVQSLRAKHTELAELAQAREVLRNVEWVPDHIPYATQPDYHRCPDCWSERREGHAPDCALSAALTAKGE